MRPHALLVTALDGTDPIDDVPDHDLHLHPGVHLSPNDLIELANRLTVHGRSQLMHQLGAHHGPLAYMHCDLCTAELEAGQRSHYPPAELPDATVVIVARTPDEELGHLVDEWGALGVAMKLLAGVPHEARATWLAALASDDRLQRPDLPDWEPPADGPMAAIGQLTELVDVLADALGHHADWCGYNATAPGHPSFNAAQAALVAHRGTGFGASVDFDRATGRPLHTDLRGGVVAPAGAHRLPVDQVRYSIEEAAMAMGLVAILRAQEGDPRPLLDKCRAALQVVRMGSNADVDTWDEADLYEAVRAALGRPSVGR